MAKRKRPGCSTGHGTGTLHVADLAAQLQRKTRVSNHIGGCSAVERPRRLANYTVWGRRFQARRGRVAAA